MKKLCGAIALTLCLPVAAQAAYSSSINLSGDFSLTGFNPAYDTDANPFTYTLQLIDLVGQAQVDIPDPSENVVWTAMGEFTADAGSNSVLPPIVWNYTPFSINDFGTLATGSYFFDFDNQDYTLTSGASVIDLSSFGGVPTGLSTVVDLTYDITSFDADGILNDVYVSFNETPSHPFFNLSSLINVLDSLPTSGQPGTIDGQFTFALQATGQSEGHAVSEPFTLGLLGLGFAGIAVVRRRKA